MNSLEDQKIIEKLYEASQAGVEIDLLVRGFCSLVPQRKDLSENIRVKSCIGQFLEHSRVYVFANGQDDMEKGKFFLGSADWMKRNLSNRIETIAPIRADDIKAKIWELIEIHWSDNFQTWELDSDGEYHLLRAEDSEKGVHQKLMEAYTKNKKRKKK